MTPLAWLGVYGASGSAIAQHGSTPKAGNSSIVLDMLSGSIDDALARVLGNPSASLAWSSTRWAELGPADGVGEGLEQGRELDRLRFELLSVAIG